MSLPATQILKCPRCGKESETLLWQSINVSLDKNLKRKLFSGKLNKFNCEHCGNQCQVEHDLLYHDMKKEFMVWLKFPDSEGKILMDSKPLETSAALSKNYKLRFVTTWRHLLEKISIFDANLDDRAIEFVKWGLWYKHAANDPSAINHLLFSQKKQSWLGKSTLIFIAGQESFSASEEAYASAMEVISNFPPEKDWALVNHEHLKNLHPELNSMITGTQWEGKLGDCDFQLAKEEIANLIRIGNQQAQKQGGEYIWKQEIADAIKVFLTQPNLESAAKLLNCEPTFYNYFEECKPTGKFAFYKRMQRK